MLNYLRFMLCAGVGLLGLGAVMTLLIDRVFCDWDVLTSAKHAFNFARDGENLWRLVEREERLLDREGFSTGMTPHHLDVWTEPLPDLSDLYGPLESNEDVLSSLSADPETIASHT